MPQFENIAFISYKREDEKWAKWMQRRLEHYKLPSEAKRIKPDTEFINNPRHVFKDTTDLSGGVLAQSIKRGLDSSKFLIVICSPRAAQSPWVCKEVQEFIDSGREEFIIPFIVEGEPNSADPQSECFPMALRSLSGERELLGININENNRDFAFVKVIARLFDIRFDILWNRFQREAKRRTRIIIAAVTVLFLILLGIIAAGGWSYQKIKSQQVEIIKQRDNATRANDKLSAANDSIVRQKETLQKAFDDLAQSQANLALSNANLKAEKDNVLQRNYMLAKNNAVLTAKEANNMIDDGDILGAINLLQSVIPDPNNPNEHPYVIELEQVMRKALQTYNSPEYKSIGVIDNIGYVYDAAYNTDGTLIATAGEDGYVRIWDAFSGKFLYSLPRQDETILKVSFDDNNFIHLSGENFSKLYNPSTYQFKDTNYIDKYKYRINWWRNKGTIEDTTFIIDNDKQLIAKRNGMLLFSDLNKQNTLTCFIRSTDSYPFDRLSYDIVQNRIGINDINDKYAYIWNLDYETIDTINLLASDIRSTSFSPANGDIVTSSRDGAVRIWHKGYGEYKFIFDHTGGTTFRKSDNIIVEADQGDDWIVKFYFYDIISNKLDSVSTNFDTGYDGWNINSKESLFIYESFMSSTCPHQPFSTYLFNSYDLSTPLDTAFFDCDLLSKEGSSIHTGFDKKGKYAYVVIFNSIAIWSIENRTFGKCLYQVIEDKDNYTTSNNYAFNDNSNLFIYSNNANNIKSIHIVNLQTLLDYKIETGELNDIMSVKFIDDENVMFQTKSIIGIVNLPSRQVTHRYVVNNMDLNIADYCKENDQIISCSGENFITNYHNIYVWDRKSEQLLYTIPNTGYVNQMAVDGSDLYVLGERGFVKYKLLNFNEVKERIMNFIPYRRKEQ